MVINPLLSIITVSAFDHERLGQTLNSLRDSIAEIEHVIVVPKHDLISIELVKNFSLTSSTHIQLLHDENAGIYPAMNIGGKHALGKYLCFWNAGDKLHSQVNLKKLIVNLASKSPSWLIVQGVFDWHAPQMMDKRAVIDFVLHRNMGFISHQTVVVARDIFVEIDGFRTKYRVAGDASQITNLFQKWDPSFLDLPIVNVESPFFAAKHNRRGRFENIRIVLFELKGPKKFCALWNILRGEIFQLFRQSLR
jgi:glycosyltransferase involved in cell wall biosynthesis